MEFIPGLRTYPPHKNAPSFIKGQIVINVAEFEPFLNEHANGTGQVRIDIKESKAGALYLQLNTFKREPEQKALEEKEPGDELPAMVF